MIDNIKWTKPATQLTQSQHPDALRNYSYAADMIKKKQDLLKNVKVVFDGVNKDSNGNYEENLCVSFYWKEKQASKGFALSFHQPEVEFKQKLEKFVLPPKKDLPPPIKRAEWLDFDSKTEMPW